MIAQTDRFNDHIQVRMRALHALGDAFVIALQFREATPYHNVLCISSDMTPHRDSGGKTDNGGHSSNEIEFTHCFLSRLCCC